MAAAGAGGGGASSVRAGRAFVELFVNDKALTSGLAKAKATLLRFGASIGKVGAGLSLAGGGILGGLGVFFESALKRGDDIKKLADRLGATTEEVSALGYAADLSGASIEELERGLRNMQLRLAESGGGGGSLTDQINEFADGLSRIEDGSERAKYVSDIFGTKIGSKLIPLLKSGSAGLRELTEEARRNGSVMNGETAAAAERFSDSITKVWTAVRNTTIAIGEAFLPLADDAEAFAQAMIDIGAGIREFIRNNTGLVQGLAVAAAVITAVGAALASLGVVAMTVGAGLGAISTIIGFLNPLTIAIAAALAGLAVSLGLIAYWLRENTRLGESFGTVWQAMINKIKAGDLRGAFRAVLLGAKLEFLQFLDDITNHPYLRILAPGVSAIFDQFRESMRNEIAAIQAELGRLAASAKSAQAKVAGATFTGRFGQNGPTKGGFGTASQLGQQFGVSEAKQTNELLREGNKNTKEIAQGIKTNGLVFA